MNNVAKIGRNTRGLAKVSLRELMQQEAAEREKLAKLQVQIEKEKTQGKIVLGDLVAKDAWKEPLIRDWLLPRITRLRDRDKETVMAILCDDDGALKARAINSKRETDGPAAPALQPGEDGDAQ
jgi:hypothetical protein